MSDGVDEESRRRHDSAAHGSIPDAPDPLGVDVGPRISRRNRKRSRPASAARRSTADLRPSASALEHGVVHLPELALRGGALGGLRRLIGVRELLGLGEAAVDVAEIRAHLLLDLLDRAVRLRARRGSEVAVSHERGSRERRTARMVSRGHLSRESSSASLTFHRSTIQARHDISTWNLRQSEWPTRIAGPSSCRSRRRRVQSFVSLEFRPASAGARLPCHAIAAPVSPSPRGQPCPADVSDLAPSASWEP